MKAILIDPKQRTLSFVILPNPEAYEGASQALTRLLGARLLDVVHLADSAIMYIDDEGLLVAPEDQHYFRIGDYSQPFAGRALVCARLNGELIDAPLWLLDTVAQHVAWVERPSADELDRLLTITITSL